jgi:hypothetical protein
MVWGYTGGAVTSLITLSTYTLKHKFFELVISRGSGTPVDISILKI